MGIEKNILSAFEWIEKNNPQYLAGIIHRKTGSQWNGDFVWREIVDCNWQLLQPKEYNPLIHKSICTYFYLDICRHRHPNFLSGAEYFRLLSSFSPSELKSVELVQGSHGVELVSNLITPVPAEIVWLIIGDAFAGDVKIEGHKMPWACFPGQLTASIKHIPSSWNWDGSLPDLWEISREKKYSVCSQRSSLKMKISGVGQDKEPIILEKVSDSHFKVHAAGNPMSPFEFTETGANGTSVEECAKDFIRHIQKDENNCRSRS